MVIPLTNNSKVEWEIARKVFFFRRFGVSKGKCLMRTFLTGEVGATWLVELVGAVMVTVVGAGAVLLVLVLLAGAAGLVFSAGMGT